MKRLRQDASLLKVKRVVEGVKLAYKCALFSGHNQEQLLINIELARTCLVDVKLTNYAYGYLAAITENLYNEFQQNLEFCYLHEGTLYSTHKDSLRPTTEILHNLNPRLTSAEWDALHRGLYYKKANYLYF
jgi:hypothetical protein